MAEVRHCDRVLAKDDPDYQRKYRERRQERAKKQNLRLADIQEDEEYTLAEAATALGYTIGSFQVQYKKLGLEPNRRSKRTIRFEGRDILRIGYRKNFSTTSDIEL